MLQQNIYKWQKLTKRSAGFTTKRAFKMNFSSEHIALQTAYKSIPASLNLHQLKLSTQPASFCLILHWSSGFWGPPPAGQDLWPPALFPEHAPKVS